MGGKRRDARAKEITIRREIFQNKKKKTDTKSKRKKRGLRAIWQNPKAQTEQQGGLSLNVPIAAEFTRSQRRGKGSDKKSFLKGPCNKDGYQVLKPQPFASKRKIMKSMCHRTKIPKKRGERRRFERKAPLKAKSGGRGKRNKKPSKTSRTTGIKKRKAVILTVSGLVYQVL